MKAADAIIVIGTELETSLPLKIVNHFKYRGKLIVEMNLNPKLTDKGKILNVAGGCEKTLPLLVDAFKKKINPPANTPNKPIPSSSKPTSHTLTTAAGKRPSVKAPTSGMTRGKTGKMGGADRGKK